MPLTQVDQGLLGQYAQYTGFKNRLINPGMVIDQRNAGAVVTASNVYTVDRWRTYQGTAGTLTTQQVSDAPSGFINSAKITTAVAKTTASNDYFHFSQLIEGLNASDLAWGSSSAQTVTLSFWVKSSLTGTFGGSIENGTFANSYVFQYTINSANTWEYKTVTIPGPTSGTWVTTNAASIVVLFDLGDGSAYGAPSANTWLSGDYRNLNSNVRVSATANATWQITGVQFEKGSTATSFDFRPYGTELALCQRYAVQLADGSTQVIATGQCFSATGGGGVVRFPVEMRAAPTITASSAAHFSLTNSTGSTAAMSGTNFGFASTKSFLCEFTGRSGSGLTAGNATIIFATDPAARLLASAEL